jgi:hypothetical protein
MLFCIWKLCPYVNLIAYIYVAAHFDNPTVRVVQCHHIVLYCLETGTPNLSIFYSYFSESLKQVVSPAYEEYLSVSWFTYKNIFNFISFVISMKRRQCFVYVHIYINTHTHTYTCTHIRACIHTYIIRTYIHTHTHTHTSNGINYALSVFHSLHSLFFSCISFISYKN